MSSRLKRLRNLLSEWGLDAIFTSQASNRRYLSGFTGSGYVLISKEKAVLATDFRYREQAKEQAPHFQHFDIKGEVSNWLPQLIAEISVKRLGLESDSLTLTDYHQVVKAARKSPPKARPSLIPTRGIVESLRAIKDRSELNLIEEATALADAAQEHARSILRPGITERELAWDLERFMKERGSESLPFEIIAASGPNSALPHAQPSSRAVREGEPVIIDLGARVNGYCSDITRTVWTGKPNKMLSSISHLVYRTQCSVIEGLRTGMRAEEVDRLARDIISDAGYGEAFGHGLGHGIGLEPHEEPRLGPNSQDTLAEGMVFTVEPGVYVAGWGGVRIEDMVSLEKGNPRIITRASKVGTITL